MVVAFPSEVFLGKRRNVGKTKKETTAAHQPESYELHEYLEFQECLLETTSGVIGTKSFRTTLRGSRMSLNCLFAAGILISLTFVVLPGINYWVVCGFRERQRIERNRGERGNDYHGRSGCGWAFGRRVFSVSVSCFFFFAMVSNGVDTMQSQCSSKVRVTRRAFPFSKFCF